MRLLIADDNPDVLDTLENYFRIRGVEVRTVSDGLDCLRSAQEFQPEVILLDIKMKKIDGDKIIDDLFELAPRVRIVVVTGSQDEALKNKVLKLGVHGYFEKPVSLVAVAQKIREIQEEFFARK